MPPRAPIARDPNAHGHSHPDRRRSGGDGAGDLARCLSLMPRTFACSLDACKICRADVLEVPLADLPASAGNIICAQYAELGCDGRIICSSAIVGAWR